MELMKSEDSNFSEKPAKKLRQMLRVEAAHTQNAVGFQIAAATLGQSIFAAIIGYAAWVLPR